MPTNHVLTPAQLLPKRTGVTVCDSLRICRDRKSERKRRLIRRLKMNVWKIVAVAAAAVALAATPKTVVADAYDYYGYPVYGGYSGCPSCQGYLHPYAPSYGVPNATYSTYSSCPNGVCPNCPNGSCTSGSCAVVLVRAGPAGRAPAAAAARVRPDAASLETATEVARMAVLAAFAARASRRSR